jgi:hypothetical protein
MVKTAIEIATKKADKIVSKRSIVPRKRPGGMGPKENPHGKWLPAREGEAVSICGPDGEVWDTGEPKLVVPHKRVVKPRIGDEPLTNAECQKRWREAHPEEVKQREARRTLDRPHQGNKYHEDEYPRHAVGIDGEGRRSPFDEQVDDYWLLQANDKDGNAGIPDLRCSEGYLSTWEILDWLFRYVHHPRRIVVGYGLSYDWQHWFRDLDDKDYMGTFKEGERCPQGQKVTNPKSGEVYFIWQIPGKFCEIQKGAPPGGKKLKIADMLGWTGDPFVKTMASWGILDTTEQAEMQAMKDLRGQFGSLSTERVVEYNRSEVIAMAEYWTRLDATIRDVFNGLTLPTWHGGACLAKGLLRQRRIEVANDYRDEPEEVQRAIHAAFSGGRIECLQLGNFDGGWVYDINSAYPASSVLLPASSGKFRERSGSDIASIGSGLAEVTWNIGLKNPYWPLTPFFWRDRNGHIHRPPYGKGAYHICEVKTALALWGEGITLGRVWEYVPDDDTLPLQFLREVYEERQKLNAQSPNKGKVLKIGPNSVYGTLAQRPRGRFKPPYRNLFLAGEITARTRVKLLSLMVRQPRGVIYCNTDGATFSDKLEGFVGNKELGGWSGPEEFSRYCIYQPGVAFRQTPEGEWKALTRGLRKASALEAREEMEKVWEEANAMGFVAVAMGDQFVRRRKAIRENAVGEAGKWVPATKKLVLRPSIGCGQLGGPSSTKRWLTYFKDFDYNEPSKPYRYGTEADLRFAAMRELRAEKTTV